MGKVDADWKDLTAEQSAAATTLGYNEALWDGNGKVAAEEKDFEELSAEEQKAATTLGYDEDEWDGKYIELRCLFCISAAFTVSCVLSLL